MKKLLGLALGIALLPGGAMAQEKTKELDSILTQWKELAKFNGTVLVAKKGKTILHKGYGIRSVDMGDAVGEKTLYITGESTEMFTATLVYKLQEEGKLKVTDTLAKYLPEIPGAKQITLMHLLTHRSGLYDYMNNDTLFNTGGVGSPRTRQDIINSFVNRPPLFAPGTKYSFSTTDYYLLGMVIEKAAGTDYYTYMRKVIIDPLKMENTGFNFGFFASWDKAQGYAILNQFRMIPAYSIDSTVSYAAASLFTNSTGMYKWAEACLQGKILKKASWQAMTTATDSTIAQGWQIKDFYGKRAVGHEGQTYGFLSSFWVVPEDSTEIIILSNDAESHTDKILDHIVAALYDKPYTLPRAKENVYLEQRRLEQYVGRYEFENGMDLNVFTKDKLLWGQARGQAEFTMLADKEPDEFFMSTVDAEFKFVRDPRTNLVTHIILRQNRKELKGRKWQ